MAREGCHHLATAGKFTGKVCSIYASAPPEGFQLNKPACFYHLTDSDLELYREELKDKICSICRKALEERKAHKSSCCESYFCVECSWKRQEHPNFRYKCLVCRQASLLDRRFDEYDIHCRRVKSSYYRNPDIKDEELLQLTMDDIFSLNERIEMNVDNERAISILKLILAEKEKLRDSLICYSAFTPEEFEEIPNYPLFDLDENLF